MEKSENIKEQKIMIKDKNFTIPVEKVTGGFFTNPLNPEKSNADPCIVYSYEEKCYYGISTGNTQLVLHKSKSLKDMFNKSESRIIYEVSEYDDTYGHLWAPELHYINKKWYIYTSTYTKENMWQKHIIVLEAKGDSPFDGFKLCGHINREVNAIDPTVYKDGEKMYICFSHIKDKYMRLCIQEMKNPWETTGKYTEIAKAEYPWEKVYPHCEADQWKINEGPYFVKSPNNRLFIFYSGNGCFCDDYVIGLLEYKGGDMLSKESWEKCPEPIMTKGNNNFGPGHATFFYSPDKTELWICHHCLHESDPEYKSMQRHCHCQKVYFDETGFPHTGLPILKGEKYPLPSGE